MIELAAAQWPTLIDAARSVRERAYAPYSRFAVGAALLAADGTIHVGANVENVAFPSGQCAEASALGVLVAAGAARPVQAVVVAAGAADWTWPCGNCRQMLAELATPDCPVRAVTDTAVSEPVALAELLPHAFASLR